MHAHRDFMAGFDAALRGGPLPLGLITADMGEIERRFAVYRNNVAVGLTAALANRFPVIQRLLGEAYFAALGRVYAEHDRPASPVLAEWGAGFAGFLDGFPPLAAYPYLGDVARIEYARGVAFHAADRPAIDPALLGGLNPDRVRLTLHPSVTVLHLTHPAVSIWAQNQQGREVKPIPNGAEVALILRDAAFQVPVQSLGAGDAALVTAIMSGALLADAAAQAVVREPDHNPQPMLVTLMRAGVIIDARD